MLRSVRRRAVYLGACAALASGCALSTHCPGGGQRLDSSPLVPRAGRMNTSLGAGADLDLHLRQGSLRVGQAYVLPGGLLFGGVLETAALSIEQASMSPDTPAIEVAGYYAGIVLKRTLIRQERIVLGGHGGLGTGGFGGYVGFADAFGGAALGFDSRVLSPYASATGGVALPYRRRAFDVRTSDILGEGSYVERYRFAAAGWFAWDFGLESPFGMPDRGPRAYVSLGQRWSRLLERDRIGSGRESLPVTVSSTSRVGLSWTY